MRDIKDLVAEVYGVVWTTDRQIKDLERFAKLVAEHEREACAKVCEGYAPVMPKSSAQFFADVIRARGKA